MITKVLISEVLDRKKAMAWLRAKTDWTFGTISKQLSTPLPVVFSVHELDVVDQYITYANDLDEIKKVYSQYSKGLLLPSVEATHLPKEEECGFKTVIEHIVSPEVQDLFVKKIEELTEIREAQKWYDEQPDDIKRKIFLACTVRAFC